MSWDKNSVTSPVFLKFSDLLARAYTLSEYGWLLNGFLGKAEGI